MKTNNARLRKWIKHDNVRRSRTDYAWRQGYVSIEGVSQGQINFMIKMGRREDHRRQRRRQRMLDDAWRSGAYL